MAYRAAPLPSESLTVRLDGFDLRLSKSPLRGKARATVLQHGRVVAVGYATCDMLAAIIGAASARRGAMRRGAGRG